MNKELIISNILKELGIKPVLRGYGYLKEAVSQAMDDMSIVHNITKKLYPDIAERFNTKMIRVERDMRHAIEIGWQQANIDVQHTIFGYTVSVNSSKPTNGEFIATVADYLLISMKE